MDNLDDPFDFHDEQIDPEIQRAIKEYCCSSKHSKSSNNNNDKYQVLSTDQIVEYVVDYVQEVNCIVQV